MPPTELIKVDVVYKLFATARSQARFDAGTLAVSLSDVYSKAPEAVREAHAWILLSKLLRKPVPRIHRNRCRRYFMRKDVTRELESLKRERGRKSILPPEGRSYSLTELFEELNVRFFFGLMARPELGWSVRPGRNILGHYDPSHHVIVLSRLLDKPEVPRYVVEYVMFHEMLHLRHPVRNGKERRNIHTPEFQREERTFPLYGEALGWLRQNWGYQAACV